MDINIINILTDKTDVNIQDEDGNIALMVAIKNNIHPYIINKIINKTTDINTINKSNQSTIDFILDDNIDDKMYNIVILLLEHGVDISKLNQQQISILEKHDINYKLIYENFLKSNKTQTGGSYYNKYLKYKNKYLKLCKNRSLYF